ncbi:MAG: hypothetical protein IJ086_14110 [Clostridium sp.]|nr:hypothetical protein [Clostridium sp.]
MNKKKFVYSTTTTIMEQLEEVKNILGFKTYSETLNYLIKKELNSVKGA